MDQLGGAVDPAAVDVADDLVAEADAEDGQLGPEVADDVDREPGVAGCPGPGEITTPSGSRARTSATVPASLRHTTVSAPSSPRYWTRLKTNES